MMGRLILVAATVASGSLLLGCFTLQLSHRDRPKPASIRISNEGTGSTLQLRLGEGPTLHYRIRFRSGSRWVRGEAPAQALRDQRVCVGSLHEPGSKDGNVVDADGSPVVLSSAAGALPLRLKTLDSDWTDVGPNAEIWSLLSPDPAKREAVSHLGTGLSAAAGCDLLALAAVEKLRGPHGALVVWIHDRDLIETFEFPLQRPSSNPLWWPAYPLAVVADIATSPIQLILWYSWMNADWQQPHLRDSKLRAH